MFTTLQKPLIHALLGLLFFISPFSIRAQCSSSGPLSAGTSANISFTGSDFNFSNTNNILSSDNNRASSTGLVTLFTGETDYLQATNFGFSIPLTAIICGIVVEVEKSATGIGTVLGIGLSYVADHSVRLVRNGTAVGNNKAGGAHWTTAESYHSYGGNNDIWGVAWTPADINSSDFGLAFSANINGLAMLIPNVRLDHVRITVYYTITLLPANILFFNATAKDNNTTYIEWKTPADRSDISYTVQRSRDGIQWENVAEKIYRSYQAGKQSYSAEDMQPYTGRSLYRLSMETLSGEITYSAVKPVNIGSDLRLHIYPNPFTNRITITGMQSREKIRLSDLSGRSIQIPNSTTNVLNLQSLQPGLYLLHIGNTIVKIQKK
jgi:hypothetical protein